MFLLAYNHVRLLPKYLNVRNMRSYFSEHMIHSFHKSLLNTFYMPGTILSSNDSVVNKTDKNSCLCRAFILEGKTDEEQDK